MTPSGMVIVTSKVIVKSKSLGAVIGRYDYDVLDCGIMLFFARWLECSRYEAFLSASIGTTCIRFTPPIDRVSLRDVCEIISLSGRAVSNWKAHFENSQFEIKEMA